MTYHTSTRRLTKGPSVTLIPIGWDPSLHEHTKAHTSRISPLRTSRQRKRRKALPLRRIPRWPKTAPEKVLCRASPMRQLLRQRSIARDIPQGTTNKKQFENPHRWERQKHPTQCVRLKVSTMTRSPETHNRRRCRKRKQLASRKDPISEHSRAPRTSYFREVQRDTLHIPCGTALSYFCRFAHHEVPPNGGNLQGLCTAPSPTL